MYTSRSTRNSAWAGILAAGALVATAAAQNLTVGDEVGADHIAFLFAPYKWQFDNAEAAYRDHVSSGAGTGQQYGYIEYVQAAAPGAGVPASTTVAQFYNLIRNEETFLGTLLITTHGTDDVISIEPFARTVAGKAARDARYDAYVNGTTGIPGLPAFDGTQIYKSQPEGAWAIGIKAKFITDYGRLTKGLVYTSACKGGTLNDDFVTANARVAVGPPTSDAPRTNVNRVTTFFKRMDGKEGQAKRPVSAARAGLGLDAAGAENTTLAPSVLTLTAPCPIKAGDIVEITLDTTCELGIIPDIVGTNCTIESETWVNNTTLRGTCTAPPPPGAYDFTITLKWDLTYSDQNVARLDGNTNPARNAEGPAHDDYVQPFSCEQPSQSDDCSTAVPIDCGVVITGDTTGATTDGFWPCTAAGSDIWYRFTAFDPNLFLSFCGSSYDTAVMVLDGCGGAVLGCNDDSCGLQSQLSVSGLTVGNTYLIAVGGFASQTGSFAMSVNCGQTSPPLNDSCFTAQFLPSPPVVISGTTHGATPDPQAPTCDALPGGGPGVWYVAQGTGTTMSASMCNTEPSFDAAISVFSGDCIGLGCVGASDDACGTAPEVSWCSEPGRLYLILVHDVGSSSGLFALQVTADFSTCNSDRFGACCLGPNNCIFTTESNCQLQGGEFLGEQGECLDGPDGSSVCSAVGSCPGDLDGDLDVDIGDLALLLSQFGMFEPGLAGDIDDDGDVDLSDLTELLSAFGVACP